MPYAAAICGCAHWARGVSLLCRSGPYAICLISIQASSRTRFNPRERRYHWIHGPYNTRCIAGHGIDKGPSSVSGAPDFIGVCYVILRVIQLCAITLAQGPPACHASPASPRGRGVAMVRGPFREPLIHATHCVDTKKGTVFRQCLICAPSGIRTLDTLIKSQLL